MADSQIAQEPLKGDVPPVDFSHVIGQTWQRPIQEAPRFPQRVPSNDVHSGYLDLGNWQELYGDGVQIAQASPKAPEAKDKVEPTASSKTEKTGLTIKNAGVPQGYLDEVQHGLDTLPPVIKAELATHNVEISVYKNINDFRKANPTYSDSRNDGGSVFDHSDPQHVRIAVFENLPDGASVKAFNYDPAGLLRHEVGHAHNFFNNRAPREDMKNALNAESREMKTKDPTRFAEMESAFKSGDLQKYKRPGEELEELYAEMFSIASGGGSDTHADALLSKYFPETLKHMRDAINKAK